MINSEPLYVSLHIPKTGGSTFRQILKKKFGDRLQYAYDEREGWPIVPDPACIHGHGIFKYFADAIARYADVRWMTFLRDPLRSAISHYYNIRWYSRQNPRVTFVDRGLETWLTHTEPFRYPDPPGYNHNRFRKWFEKRSIERYDFVGLTEQFDESLVLLYHQFGWEPLTYQSENVGGYGASDLPAAIVARFCELNAADYVLYDHVAKRFETCKQTYGPAFEADVAAFRARLRGGPTGEGAGEYMPQVDLCTLEMLDGKGSKRCKQ
jgi:hypothetical protein